MHAGLCASACIRAVHFKGSFDVSFLGAGKENSGKTSDLKGAKVTVTGYVNGEPRTQLELLEGFRKVPFGLGAP